MFQKVQVGTYKAGIVLSYSGFRSFVTCAIFVKRAVTVTDARSAFTSKPENREEYIFANE